jgi:hypothetical protein
MSGTNIEKKGELSENMKLGTRIASTTNKEG